MNNHLPDIVSIAIEDARLQNSDRDPAKLEQNGKPTTSWSFKTQNFKLLTCNVDNFQDCINLICQNWLKAHETESLCSENIQRYTRIVLLLQDIVELIEKIEAVIQRDRQQKQEISQTVGTIVSNCLDIEPERLTPTASLANDLGIDSLSWQELLITLEETFAIRISDEIAGTLVTVQQLINYIVLTVQKKNRRSTQLQY